MTRWILIVMVAACSDGESPRLGTDGGVDDSGAGEDAPPGGCAPEAFWTVTANGGTARVYDANLQLSAPTLTTAPAISVSQGGITGTFRLAFSVNSWMSGGTGASVEATLSADVADPTEVISAALTTDPETAMTATHLAMSQSKPTSITNRDISLSFQRGDTGNVNISASAEDAHAGASGQFPATPLRVTIRLRSTGPTIATPTHAEIGGFTFEGTGAMNDSFNCD